MSWLSGFLATEKPRSAASAAHLRLRRVAEREERAGQLVGVEDPEHVGLVLGGVDRAVQLAPARPAARRPARSGRWRRRRTRAPPPCRAAPANLIRSLQRRQGLGVRPAAYSATKSSMTSRWKRLGEVPDVERDAEEVGHPAGVAGVLDGAAAAGRPRAASPRAATGRGGRRRPRGRRRASGRRRRRSRPRRTSRRRRASAGTSLRPVGPARRRAGSAASTASTSASVEVWPRERRSAPRASASGIAHGQQHVARLRDPGLARRAGASTRPRRRRGGRGASRPRTRGRAGGRCRRGGAVASPGGPAAAHGDAEAEAEGALDEPVAQPHEPRWSRRRGHRRSPRARRRTRGWPGTSRVPLRTCRSCPPPWASGTSAASRRASSAPDAERPADLVAADR